MSSLINIFIPKQNTLPSSKEGWYIANNVINTAEQIGITAAGSAVRTGLYGTKLLSPPIMVKPHEDWLRLGSFGADNRVILKTVAGVMIEFIDAKINVAKKNSFVSTELVNRSGRVKERIQADDYDVIISGSLFVDKQGEPPYGQYKFPYEKIEMLNTILSETRNIEVASAYLDLFKIHRLVLKSADFNQDNLRHFNVMPFKLTFVSDMDYDFLVND